MTPVGPHDGLADSQPNGDTVEMNDRDSASEQSTPEPVDVPIPVEERLTNPYPKPVRRSRKVVEEPELPDFESLTLPESSLSDMPLTNTALFEALGLTPPVEATSEVPDPAGTAEDAPHADTNPTAADDAPHTDTTTTAADDAPRTDTTTTAADDAPDTDTTPTVAATTTARHSSRPAADNRAPIWSEDWDAWIYWDTTLQTWFRHDMQRGVWMPMDED